MDAYEGRDEVALDEDRPDKIEVLLVDDQPIFRRGLRSVLDDWDGFEVVGEASNGKEGLKLTCELLPDIVLMDINMPVMDGIEATRRIHEEMPSQRIVILTVSDEEEGLFEAIKNGAQGYLLKDTPARRLRSELRSVMSGETPLSGVVAAKILAEYRRSSADASAGMSAGMSADVTLSREACPADLRTLTAREHEVLMLLAEGLSNSEIAERLVVSEKTVKKHLSNIFAKLHLTSRLQAAIYAVNANARVAG